MTRAVRTKVAKAVVLGAVMIGAGALGGCVSSPDSSIAAAETPASASATSSAAGPAISMASMGVSLQAVAAGRIERPSIQGQARATMAAVKARTVGTGAMNMAQSALSLNPVAVGMSAVGTGMMMGQMAAADAAIAEAEAQAEVQRKANLIVPDEDRPNESMAILSIADKAAGSSASWTNPATGASGTVTLGKPHKVMNEMGCRSGTRTYRYGSTSRRGDFLICREGEDWYDLS